MDALAKNLHWNYVIADPAPEVPDLAALGLRLLRYTLQVGRLRHRLVQ